MIQAWAQLEMQQENNHAARQLFEVIVYFTVIMHDYQFPFPCRLGLCCSSFLRMFQLLNWICLVSFVLFSVFTALIVMFSTSICRKRYRQAPRIGLHGMSGECLKLI